MEIEFENDDSGDNIRDGEAESFVLQRCFSRMTSMAKNELSVWGATVGRMKTVRLSKTTSTLCVPCAEKVYNCKLHNEIPTISH